MNSYSQLIGFCSTIKIKKKKCCCSLVVTIAFVLVLLLLLFFLNDSKIYMEVGEWRKYAGAMTQRELECYLV